MLFSWAVYRKRVRTCLGTGALTTRQIVEAVIEVWDSGSVGIRLSPTTPDAWDTPMDSQVMETYGYLTDEPNACDPAYLHCRSTNIDALDS